MYLLEILLGYTECTLTFIVFLLVVGQGELAIKVIDQLSYSPKCSLDYLLSRWDYLQRKVTTMMREDGPRYLVSSIIGVCVGLLIVVVYHLSILEVFK